MNNLTFISLKDFRKGVVNELTNDTLSEEPSLGIRQKASLHTYLLLSTGLYLFFFTLSYFAIQSFGFEGFKTGGLFGIMFGVNSLIFLIFMFNRNYAKNIYNLIVIQLTNTVSGLVCIVGCILFLNEYWVELIYPFIYPSLVSFVVFAAIIIFIDLILWWIEMVLIKPQKD